jgi:hypothetical protein
VLPCSVQHKIFVDSLHERFRNLKALERKTKSADLRALFLNVTSSARDEGIESKHSDKADTSYIALAATGKRHHCTICDKRTHTKSECFEGGGGRSNWTKGERTAFFDQKKGDYKKRVRAKKRKQKQQRGYDNDESSDDDTRSPSKNNSHKARATKYKAKAQRQALQTIRHLIRKGKEQSKKRKAALALPTHQIPMLVRMANRLHSDVRRLQVPRSTKCVWQTL